VAFNCKPLSVFAQLQTYQFVQIDSLQKIETRPVFVFIHTTWCKYCAAMEHTTFKDKAIIEVLNKKYYCIFLDAETKQDIFFNNHLFKYKATGNNTGSHELAEQLAFLNGQIAFPTICILNEETEIAFQQSNYLSSADLKKILNTQNNHN
jgi:thioredoxin-related protein